MVKQLEPLIAAGSLSRYAKTMAACFKHMQLSGYFCLQPSLVNHDALHRRHLMIVGGCSDEGRRSRRRNFLVPVCESTIRQSDQIGSIILVAGQHDVDRRKGA